MSDPLNDPELTDRPLEVPLEDFLDLHTFRPQEVPSLLEVYLQECVRIGFPLVRIIHGKGRGILRLRVRAVLERLDCVLSYYDAPPESGHWGATMVRLQR